MSLFAYGPKAGLKRERKPRAITRRIYVAASSSIGELHRIVPSWGAWEREVDAEGNTLNDKRVGNTRLFANIGDTLIVSNKDVAIDEVASVAVVRVEDDGATLHVKLTYGVMPRSRDVFVQRCKIGGAR